MAQFVDYRPLTRRWFVAFGAICALCCGCSQKMYWHRPDKTLVEAERDCRECYRQAQAEAAEATWDQRLDRTQMRGASDDQQWSYAYQDSRFRRCMKRNGYRLTPEDELKPPVEKRVLRMGNVQSCPIAGK
jgi:hypothetical protein